MKFKNSQEAFEKLYNNISKNGINYSETKCLHNIGFEILNPLDNIISTDYRNWKPNYAEIEWQWYLSENPNATEIAKFAKIWNKCMDINGNVNSNYGWQWG
jgi:hypothetical protein